MDPIIACDLYRYAGKADYPTLLKHLLLNRGFKFTYCLRQVAKRKPYSPMWLFFKLLHRRYFYKYGYQIPFATTIGKGLFIAHFGNVVLHAHATLGSNCNLAHSITVGQANRGKRKGCPTIGNRVWIGTGAVVVGKIVIGNNVLIAPNAYVNCDVPSNSVVIGNPAKVIAREDATAGYIESIMAPAPEVNRDSVPAFTPDLAAAAASARRTRTLRTAPFSATGRGSFRG